MIWGQLTPEERELLRDAEDGYVPLALVPRLQELGAIPDGPAHRPHRQRARRVETVDGIRYQLDPDLRAYVAAQPVAG